MDVDAESLPAWTSTSIPARIKMINPILTMGPSRAGEIIAFSPAALRIRLPWRVLCGTTVQVRVGTAITVGTVRASLEHGPGCEIQVDIDARAALTNANQPQR